MTEQSTEQSLDDLKGLQRPHHWLGSLGRGLDAETDAEADVAEGG